MQFQKCIMPYNLPEFSKKPDRLFSSQTNRRLLNNNQFKFKQFKKLSSNPNVRYKENNELLEDKIKERLLTSINKHSQNSLGSLNSANFLYQIYEKGKNIIENPNKESKELVIKNSFKNKTSFKERSNTFSNMPTYYITNNFNISQNTRKKYNRLKTLTSTFELNSLPNFESPQSNTKIKNYIDLAKKNELSNTKNTRYENSLVKLKIVDGKAKKLTDSNGIEHLALIPKKNFIECQNKCNSNNRKIPTKKKLYLVNKKYKRAETYDKDSLKVFSEKYKKDKKDFNNILFDEYINPKKKKVPLENFIKQFSDVHFIDKLYLSQDIQ